jgi:hypothetical protein
LPFEPEQRNNSGMSAPVESPENISPLERYQVFRNRIEHEDNLILQRLSWLMASQSFLFTAYAIVTNGMSASSMIAGNVFVNRLATLEQIIPIVALLNSLLIFISILAALKAIRELRYGYQQHAGTLEMIPLQTSRVARVSGLSAPVLLPLLFFAVWLFLLAQ